jgi:hypothetical protein
VADWPTISSLATAGGTLVLATATFASVRSANRAARAAEESLLVGLRPLLMPARLQDPPQKVGWRDEHWARIEGGQAHAEVEGGAVYLALALRNAGSGIAVLHGGRPSVSDPRADTSRPDLGEFRMLARDLYVPAGDIGFWQTAYRPADDGDYGELVAAVEGRQPLLVDVLYGDHEGGQRAITRFGVRPAGDGGWLCIAVRHWNVDRPDPR